MLWAGSALESDWKGNKSPKYNLALSSKWFIGNTQLSNYVCKRKEGIACGVFTVLPVHKYCLECSYFQVAE